MKNVFGTQTFPWLQYYQRQARDLEAHFGEAVEQIAAAGFDACEPSVANEEAVKASAKLIQRYGLKMPSIYDNLRLHDDEAPKVIEKAVRVAQVANEYGAEVFVVNPEPIQWHSTLDKSDAQLRIQAQSMQVLGEKLRELGMWLAFHIHAPEMRQAAREFHHTLLATSPDAVGLCLDTHWIYRGAGNSEVALFDIIQLYANRVKSLHLRQSSDGVWSEAFGPGDIDHEAVAAELKAAHFSGPVVLEQALEEGTPDKIGFEAAQKQGLEYAKRIFGW